MPNLKRLDLDKNYLTGLPANLFENNPELQFANFLNNRIRAVPESLFAKNANLEVVWFSGNMVSILIVLIGQYQYPISIKTLNNHLLFRSRKFPKTFSKITRNCSLLNLVEIKSLNYQDIYSDPTSISMRLVLFSRPNLI